MLLIKLIKYLYLKKLKLLILLPAKRRTTMKNKISYPSHDIIQLNRKFSFIFAPDLQRLPSPSKEL